MKVELCGIGGKKRIARIGAMFGEMAILGLSPNGRRLRSATTISHCELVELPKEALTEVMVMKPAFFNIVRKACNLHLEWLNESYEENRGSVGLSGKSAETGHDFYDNLSFIDWRAIRLELEPELNNGIQRSQAAHFKQETKQIVEEKSGAKALMNMFHFQLHSLRVTTTSDAKRGQVVIKWKGLPDVPETSAFNETATFRWKQEPGEESTFELNRELKLPLLVPSGYKWTDLEALEVKVYLLDNETRMQRQNEMKMQDRRKVLGKAPAKAKTPGLQKVWNQPGTMMYPSAKPILVAELPLQLCVDKRKRGDHRTSPFTVEFPGDKISRYSVAPPPPPAMFETIFKFPAT
jgi:hypothetical protein